MGGATLDGLLGAEFKLEGHRFGDGWFGSCEGASDLVIGEVTGSGANIAFTSCQTSNPVLLFTCSGFNDIENQPCAYLDITEHDDPSNENFPCPHLNECSEGLQICSNTYDASYGQGAWCLGLHYPPVCTTSVEQTTWSSVKGLFAE